MRSPYQEPHKLQSQGAGICFLFLFRIKIILNQTSRLQQMSKQIKLRADKQGNKIPSKQTNKQTKTNQTERTKEFCLFVLIPQFAVGLLICVDLILFFFFLCMFWLWLLICSLSGVTCEHSVAQAVSQFAAPDVGEKRVQVEIVVRAVVTLCGIDVRSEAV